jgi:ubiquinone/menaquinone biosynthesis C-methylase UbiE
MIPRVLEPEVMDSPEEADAYDAMDHGQVNRAFVDDLLEFASGRIGGDWLDLGTGTALVPIEIARREPTVRVVGLEMSGAMLAIAARRVARERLEDRIALERADAKRLPFPMGRFSGVLSNSIVHHIADPILVVEEAVRVTARGGLVFFRDLARPATHDALQRLVEQYAGDATEHQRKLFADSLHAALSVEEMQELVSPLGERIEGQVRATSDRHWTWSGRKRG